MIQEKLTTRYVNSHMTISNPTSTRQKLAYLYNTKKFNIIQNNSDRNCIEISEGFYQNTSNLIFNY